MVAEKVLGKELDQGRKHKQTRGDCIHGADEDETEFGVGAVQGVCGEANGLTNWSSDDM